MRSRRLLSEGFASAEAFDARVSLDFEVQSPSCVLLDVRMGGLSGLAMFEKLIDYGLLPTLPVIFLTGHADVPTAVGSVKRGAFDFFEKPFSDNALVDRVEQALAQSAAALAEYSQATGLRTQLDGLTERELQVLRLLDSELTGPQIARELFVSHNTLRTHTKHIFTKLDVTTRRAAVAQARERGLLQNSRRSHG